MGRERVPLYVSPDAQLKYARPGRNAFDADLIRIAERLITPSDVIWDIGANVGVFALCASAVAHSGESIAIEADIWLCDLIRRSAALKENRGRPIRVLPCAVSKDDGVASFQIAKRGRASNALVEAGGREQMGGVRETVDVPTLSMDTLVKSLPAPTFIKIDVEGAELSVLEGGKNVLGESRPLIYAEIGQEVAAPVRTLVEAFDYTVCDEAGRPSNQWTWNSFLAPSERVADGQLEKQLRG